MAPPSYVQSETNESTKKPYPSSFHGIVSSGTQAFMNARALRELGAHAESLTMWDKFGRPTDQVLGNDTSTRTQLAISTAAQLGKRLRRTDVFHYYGGSSLLPRHLDLPLVRSMGKVVVCHYLGTDVQLYAPSVAKYRWTNRAAYGGRAESDRRILRRLKWETKHSDLQIVCAPYLSEFVPGAELVPLSVDISSFDEVVPTDCADGRKVRIIHAPTHRGNKGTKYVVEAIEELKAGGQDVAFKLIENQSHSEYLSSLMWADIVVEQLIGGWHGTVAIEAMASGKCVVSFLRPEFTDIAPYSAEIPIVSATPDDIGEELRGLLENRRAIRERARRGIEYVRRVHSSDVVARRLLDLYEDCM